MTITDYPVSGMTCDHCVSAVTAELTNLSGVTCVAVGLAPGSVSTVTVTSETPLRGSVVAAAIEEAGYRLCTTC